ncbi:protoporphyrinogen/coproporphyrinogen oxidase, partial [Streptomyces albus]
GVGRLPVAVAEAVTAKGAAIRLSTPVRELRRIPAGDGAGWLAVTAHEALRADAVVLATPAPSAARLLGPHAPAAAAVLGRVEYASMALVTLAFRRSDTERLPPGSGFLVPPVDGHAIKASTFSSHKWDWVAAQDPSLFVLRTSLGRYGEERVLERDDAELVELSLRDLRAATGLDARPVDTLVSRWDGGLPQYPVGHLQRVAAVRAAVDALPGLAVAGAVYEGVGVPACVAGGRRAARHVLQSAESVNENGEKASHE